MNNPAKISANIKRRHTLPLAATAAALSLSGCDMFTRQAAAPMSLERQEAERQVKQYQSDIELALDNVDREHLRAIAEKKAPTPAIAPSQSPVILASSTPSDPPAAPPTPPAHPTTPVAVATPISAPTPAATLAPTPAPRPIATVAPPSADPLPTQIHDIPTTTFIPLIVETSTKSDTVVPMSGDPAKIPSDETSPLSPSPTPTVSAMGTMTTMVIPTQDTPIAPPPAVAPAEATLDDALTVLRKNVGQHPTLNTVMALALLDGTKGGDALKELSESDQKVLTDLLGAFDAMKTPAPAASLAERAAPLVEVAKHWQEDADLTLPRMVLATRVDSFGVFTPVAGTFEQGKRHTVIIYCEVANFSSKKSDDGWYTTRLTQQETLITDDGLLVWRPNPEEVEDRSMNQRHDFYLVKKLTIPETLAAGKYTLRMNVTDKNTNKISVVSMPVELQAK